MNDLPEQTRIIIGVLRHMMALLTDEQRLEVLSQIKEGYCEHCGRDESGVPFSQRCQCWNDE